MAVRSSLGPRNGVHNVEAAAKWRARNPGVAKPKSVKVLEGVTLQPVRRDRITLAKLKFMGE